MNLKNNSKDYWKETIFDAHKLILLLNWAFLIEVAMISVMYLKSYRKYIW